MLRLLRMLPLVVTGGQDVQMIGVVVEGRFRSVAALSSVVPGAVSDDFRLFLTQLVSLETIRDVLQHVLDAGERLGDLGTGRVRVVTGSKGDIGGSKVNIIPNKSKRIGVVIIDK